MEESIKKKANQDFYTARFMPDITVPPNPRHEHCVASLSRIKMIGRNKDQQVRIERPTANGAALALYTVEGVHEHESDIVFVGYRNLEDLEKRLELSNTDPFTGKVKAQVTAEGLTDEQAEKRSEFIERLTDNGNNRGLIVIAPHGGKIEEYTDMQAEHVGKQFSSEHVSEWICKGFKKPHGAFDRWHITSTDISEESFPKLKKIIGRQFKYSIAFHGWSGDSICIGGSMLDDLKQQIKTAVEGAVLGSRIVVAVAEDDGDDETCPEGYNGNNPYNIVNRLGKPKGGLQIEQCMKARECYGIKIATAVADVMRTLIKV
jgi:phage replication-related protein YjqB (UPF0714/DUF867 family)